MKFRNTETKLVDQYYGTRIANLIDGNKGKSVEDLMCLVSEEIESEVKETMKPLLAEGLVSELVLFSMGNVDYEELVRKIGSL